MASEPVSLQRDGNGGRVRLLLRNDSSRSGALRVRFFGTDGRVALVGADPPQDLRLELLPGTDARVAARSLHPIGVRLTATGRGASIPPGTLVAELAGAPTASPAVVTVAPPSEKPTFYQEAIEVTVTRKSPFGGKPRVDVPLANSPGGEQDLARAKLLSGSGDEVDAVLGPPSAGKAELTIGNVPSAGKYAGKLVPRGDRADELGLTVHVQDWFVYPLVVLVAGVMLGGYGLQHFELWRRGAVMRRTIGDARDKWCAAARPPALDTFDFDAASQPARDALHCPGSVDDLEMAWDAADQFLDCAQRWLRLAQSLDELGAALEALVVADPQLPRQRGTVRWDTEAMLAERYSGDDGPAADAAVERITSQAVVVGLYTRALKLGGGTAAATIYDEAGPEVDRSEWLTRRLTDRLSRLVRRLIGDAALTQPRPEVRMLSHFVDAGGMVAANRAARMADTFDVVARLRDVQRPPEDVRRTIRLWDKTVFSLQASVIAVAFLLSAYVGKDFGGWESYFLVFAAGFAGTVAIPWQLLFRSTRLPGSTPAAADRDAPDGARLSSPRCGGGPREGRSWWRWPARWLPRRPRRPTP
ncbi:MAG: hypothetical protein M3141_06310 [Actinomycetota bacterium]|nr:hypothetical protein [Actinomycetota bacterium]